MYIPCTYSPWSSLSEIIESYSFLDNLQATGKIFDHLCSKLADVGLPWKIKLLPLGICQEYQFGYPEEELAAMVIDDLKVSELLGLLC